MDRIIFNIATVIDLLLFVVAAGFIESNPFISVVAIICFGILSHLLSKNIND